MFSDHDESILLQRSSCGVKMSSCLFALVCLFFFLRCLVEIMDNRNVEMLVNAGQELHSAKIILRETVSTNLVLI